MKIPYSIFRPNQYFTTIIFYYLTRHHDLPPLFRRFRVVSESEAAASFNKYKTKYKSIIERLPWLPCVLYWILANVRANNNVHQITKPAYWYEHCGKAQGKLSSANESHETSSLYRVTVLTENSELSTHIINTQNLIIMLFNFVLILIVRDQSSITGSPSVDLC